MRPRWRRPEPPPQLDGFRRRLAERTREVRGQQGVGAEEVARVAGVSLDTYLKIEGAVGLPTVGTLIRVALALGVAPGELLTDGAPPAAPT